MFHRSGRARHWRAHHEHGHHGPGHGRGFGIRRPLRFLIDKLGLTDDQTSEVSKILEDLRLEREQADLDRRRARAKVAELLESDTLDQAALQTANEVRVAAAGRERDAATAAVTLLHAVLSPDQRRAFATLLRGGPFAL